MWYVLGAAALLWFIVSRIILFVRFGSTPLGYDTGFYLQYYQLIVPAGVIGNSLTTSHISYIPWFFYGFLGLSPITVITAFHLFHQTLFVLSIIFFIYTLAPRHWALATISTAITLLATSITQFLAYWWMFYKQSMALPYDILALALLIRGSWLTIPIAGFGAAVHLQSAFPFVVAVTVWVLVLIVQPSSRRTVSRWKLAGIVLLMPLLVLVLKGPKDLSLYIDYVRQYKAFASTAPSWEVEQAKGLFIPPLAFQLSTLFYLPLSIYGLFTLKRWVDPRRPEVALLLTALVGVMVILVAFPFLYQHRSLILLDMILLVLATAPLAYFLQWCSISRPGKALALLLLLGMFFSSGAVVASQQPQLYADERREIEAIAQWRKPDDYAMATTALYTPWVYAFTNFEATIAPGWLSWDKWTLPMWKEFWYRGTNERRRELLNMYGTNDIYLFAGRHQILSPSLRSFLDTDPSITKMSPHVWRFSPSLPATPSLP